MNVKRKSKSKKRIRRQKIFVVALLVLVVSMGGYQLINYIQNIEKADDLKYTAVMFNAPMHQSIEVLMISATDEKISIIDNSSSKIEYSDIKNYKEENLSRYAAYHKLNPNLLDAEVIWRVNTNLDYEFYTNISVVDNPLSFTVVVNKYNRLPSDFQPEDLVLMENESKELYLREDAYQAYLEMREAMAKLDLKIEAISGFRGYNTQSRLYNKYVDEHGQTEADTFSARPGHSGHQTGLVVDVSNTKLVFTDFGKTEEYAWVKDNAHRYGFIVRYKDNPELTGYQVEPWHLRYVGKDVAVDMYESNIHILEEYLDKKGIQ